MKLEFSRHIFEKKLNTKFHQNRLVRVELFRRTDRRRNMKLILAFRNFALAFRIFALAFRNFALAFRNFALAFRNFATALRNLWQDTNKEAY